MRVCFVINKFSFLMSHRFNLLSEIAKKHDVEVITDIRGALNKDIIKCQENNIILKPLKQRSEKSFFSYLTYFYKLKKELYQNSYDQIFFVTIELSIFGALIKNRKFFQRKYFLITGLGAFFESKNLKYRIARILYNLIFKKESKNKSSKFIFQNNENRDIFISLGYSTKKNSELIFGNGVTEQIIDKKITQDNIAPLKFCFAGNLTESKGVRELLKATREIIAENDLELIIAGKHEENKLDFISERMMKEIHESTYIKYLGFVEHSKMAEVYLNSDIFILPSYGEGIPNSALEAASYSLPLILSDIGGCRECINNNGLLVKPRDSHDLKEKILQLIKNPDMIDEMSKNSLLHVNKNFGLNVIARKYLNLMEKSY